MPAQTKSITQPIKNGLTKNACRIKRHTLRKPANRKHRDPSNIDIRNEYHDILKDYKNTLKLKNAEFHQQK
jgi:hypothetical protein